MQFTLLALTSAVALLVECGLLIYTTFSAHVNTVGSLVLLVIVEVVPAAAMVRTLFFFILLALHSKHDN